MAARSLSTDTVATRDGDGRRPRRPRLAVPTIAFAAVLLAGPADAKEKTTHLLTLTDIVTEPARAGAAKREPACLLRFSLRRVAKKPWKLTADLRLEFADPSEGHDGSLFGTVGLDLDDGGDGRRTMRIDGIDCDGLRPLNLGFACATDDGRCPAGTRIRLKNFDRLEIAEDVLAFD
jgi:hypothetical protein